MAKMYYNTVMIECETEDQANKLFEVLSNKDNIFNSKLPSKYEDRSVTCETTTYTNGNYKDSKIYYKISTPSYAPIEFFTMISEYYNVRITLCFIDMNLYYATKMLIKDAKITSNETVMGGSETDISIKMDILTKGEIDYENAESLILSEYFSDDANPESKNINDIGKTELYKYLKDILGIEKDNLKKLKEYFDKVYFTKKK